MYLLYKERVGGETVSLSVFSKIFQEFKFELVFFKPKKYQYTLCNNRTNGKNKEHVNQKEAIKEVKEDKTVTFANHDRFLYATFDFRVLFIHSCYKD